MAAPPRRRALVIVACLLTLLVTGLIALDPRLETNTHHVSSDKLTGTVRIALLTDLHSYQHGTNQSTLVAAIEASRPDIIALGGDIADDDEPHDGTRALLSALTGRWPLFYVTGNHEWWSLEVDAIKGIFRDAGVRVLAGDCVTQSVRNQRVRICGVDDPEVGRGEFATQIAATKNDTTDYSVLIAHRPDRINAYLPAGHDLILSGHTHGGQVRIPVLLPGLYAPNQGWFPKLGGGLYTYGDTELVISRGLVVSRPRVFNRPELVVIEIGPE